MNSFDLNNKCIYNDINCSDDDDNVYAGHDSRRRTFSSRLVSRGEEKSMFRVRF